MGPTRISVIDSFRYYHVWTMLTITNQAPALENRNSDPISYIHQMSAPFH